MDYQRENWDKVGRGIESTLAKVEAVMAEARTFSQAVSTHGKNVVLQCGHYDVNYDGKCIICNTVEL